jgi:hypothetical protein
LETSITIEAAKPALAASPKSADRTLGLMCVPLRRMGGRINAGRWRHHICRFPMLCTIGTKPAPAALYPQSW